MATRRFKPTTNGHVHMTSSSTDDDESSQKVSPKSNNKLVKPDDTPVAKNKVKKITKQEPAKEEKTPQPIEGEDGEWTTMSRKGKKQKNKKEDGESRTEKAPDSPPAPQEPEKQSPETKPSPKEKRNKKKKAESKVKEVPKSDDIQVQEVESEVVKEDLAAATESSPVVTEVVIQPEEIEAPAEPLANTSPPESEVQPGATVIPEPNIDVEDVEEPQPKKSPKKKKKGRPTPVASSQTSIQESSPQPVEEVIESGSKIEQTSDDGATEGAVKPDSNEESDKKEAFNEMGEPEESWTEAKPQRKKKKARRET